jgi:hypothetical protein
VLINDETSLVDLCMTGILGVREVLMGSYEVLCHWVGSVRFNSGVFGWGGAIQLFS